jgi:hypothetical protein
MLKRVIMTLENKPMIDHSSSDLPESGSRLESFQQALAFFAEEDNVIDRFEAEGLTALLLKSQQPLSSAEKQILTDLLKKHNFNRDALKILQDLLR